MTGDRLLPAAGWRAEGLTEVKRSRFYAVAARVDDEVAARALFAEARTRWPEARHHCTAFIVEAGVGPPTARSSDDGEPAGTAGMPMLNTLAATGVVNLAVVVTRYFGGVKLGTGGLARAYADAVAQVVTGLPRVKRLVQPVWRLALSHAEAGRVTEELLRRGVVLIDQSYAASGVELDLVFAPEAVPEPLIAQVSRGLAALSRVGEQTVEIVIGN